jgi:hypothetical protein
MAKRTHDNGASEPTPVFDYSNYSRREQKVIARRQIILQRMSERLDRYDEWEDDEHFTAGLDEFERLQDEALESVLKYVVSIPREWLVPDAPPDLDWKKAESLDWLQTLHIQDLLNAAAAAREPEQVSGN